MLITSITIGTILLFALVLAIPLGRVFRIDLRPGDYTHIDGLRAVAALMVVCSHYLAHAALIMNGAADTRLIEALGAVGVQIFFCITGFLFTRKALNKPIVVSELIASRIRRIVPLYVFVMTAAIAIAVFIATSANKAETVEVIDVVRAYAYGFFVAPIPTVAGMSIGGQAGQMWTLAWEWRFYLAVPFIGALVARRAWGFAAMAFAVGCLVVDHGLYNAVPPWAFFVPGVVCALGEKLVDAGERVRMGLSAAGAVAFLAALSFDMPLNGYAQTVLCSVGFACVLFGHRTPLSFRPIRLLGEVSYSVYLLHLIITSVFWMYVQNESRFMFYQTPGEKLPLAVAALAGLFVLSFATYALIERPFMRHSPSGTTASSPIVEVNALSQ